MNFKTDHEVRGIPDIVSEGRPQRRARRKVNTANGSATTRRETVEVLPVRRMLQHASARYRNAVVAQAALVGRAACDGLGPVFAELGAIRRIFLNSSFTIHHS